MKKVALIKTASALTVVAGSLLPMAAHAAVDYGNDTAATAAGGAAAAGIVGFFLIIWIFLIAVGLGFFIFWVIMLIDAFKRTNWEDENQKNLWLIILIASIFLGLAWLSAVLYFFIIKRALDAGKPTGTASVTSPKPSEPKK